MSLGVRFDLKIAFIHIHFTFHIGAQLALAGPPFHGKAHIDLDVISFDVTFGDFHAKPEFLSWTQFREMLPGKAENDQDKTKLLSVKVTNRLVRKINS